MQMRRPPLRHDEIEARFHAVLGRLTHAHAKLDLQVGWMLRWLGEAGGHDVAATLTPQVTLAQRLRRLREVTGQAAAPVDPEVAETLGVWLTHGAGQSGLRNDYTRGRWGVPGRWDGDDPEVEFVPIHWQAGRETAPPPQRFKLSELAAQAAEIERLADRLHLLAWRAVELAEA